MSEEVWVERLKEVISPRFGDRGYATIDTSKYVGKTIRITVEELQPQCCEKWQGRYACLMRDWQVEGGGDCKFCPECGRKLKEG